MKFYYSYDSNGTLYNVKYTLNDNAETKSYFYTHNSRGDIVGIYSGSGVLTAQYEYDAWGNVLSVTDKNGKEITDETHIGILNPFRYRGYYYDSETGFYYLMTRYYDPVTHRFVNADGYFQAGSDILDTNMNAYCRNNPIMYYDPTGEISSSEMLFDIAFNKNSKWSIKDVTRQQIKEQELPKISIDIPSVIAYGSVRTTNYKGWTVTVHSANTNTKTQTHVHIEKYDLKYSQNIDGSPHDGSSGSPPNSVKKALKEQGVWDWDANAENYRKNNPDCFTQQEVDSMFGISSQLYGNIYVMPIGITGQIPTIGLSSSTFFGFSSGIVLA